MAKVTPAGGFTRLGVMATPDRRRTFVAKEEPEPTGSVAAFRVLQNNLRAGS